VTWPVDSAAKKVLLGLPGRPGRPQRCASCFAMACWSRSTRACCGKADT